MHAPCDGAMWVERSRRPLIYAWSREATTGIPAYVTRCDPLGRRPGPPGVVHCSIRRLRHPGRCPLQIARHPSVLPRHPGRAGSGDCSVLCCSRPCSLILRSLVPRHPGRAGSGDCSLLRGVAFTVTLTVRAAYWGVAGRQVPASTAQCDRKIAFQRYQMLELCICPALCRRTTRVVLGVRIASSISLPGLPRPAVPTRCDHLGRVRLTGRPVHCLLRRRL